MLTSQNPDPSAGRTFILFRPFVAGWQWMFPPTQAHEDRQSKVARILAGLFLLGLCFGMMAVVALNARAWHDKFQTWQSNRLVGQAKSLEKEGKFVEAWLKVHEAYSKDAENPEVLRVMAKFYTLTKKKEAGWFFDRLRSKGALTDEDVVFEIESLANISENRQAQDQIEKVLLRSNPTEKIVELADQVMRRNARGRQLLDILKTYVTQDPGNIKTRLLLAMRQVELGTEQEAKEGVASLWELAVDEGKTGLEALEFLDRIKVSTTDEKKRLTELLAQHPLATEEHRIAALRLLVEIEPWRKDAIIDRAIRERRNGVREDLVPLARWLSLDGENERLLSFLKEDMVRSYPPLLENYLNALTQLNRTEDLERLVKDKRTQLTTAQRAFHLVHLAFVSNKGHEEVNSLLIDALAAAQNEGQQQMVLVIADYAEKRGHLLVAEQAYRSASRSTRATLKGYEGLLRLTYRNGNTKGFAEAARETMSRWPEKEFFMERYFYSSLISGVDMETAIPQVERLLRERPSDSMRKLLVALAHMRQLDPKAGALTLNQVNLSDLSIGQGAVLCGIMQAAGHVEQARKIARQIPDGAVMLPEELRFLQSAR